MAGNQARSIVELMTGKQVNMQVNLTNQEAVPDWESMPVSVKEEVEREIQRIAMDATKA